MAGHLEVIGAQVAEQPEALEALQSFAHAVELIGVLGADRRHGLQIQLARVLKAAYDQLLDQILLSLVAFFHAQPATPPRPLSYAG